MIFNLNSFLLWLGELSQNLRVATKKTQPENWHLHHNLHDKICCAFQDTNKVSLKKVMIVLSTTFRG